EGKRGALSSESALRFSTVGSYLDFSLLAADIRMGMGKDERREIARRWQEAGVVLEDPDSLYAEPGITIGAGTVIGPNVQLRGKTRIGKDCRIDGSAYLSDAELGDRVHLRFSVVVSDAKIGDEAIIGPFAHLRPGTELGERVHIGNFVETKKAVVGEGT